MLLRQILESPQNSSKLVVFDPFREPDREELVREIIGLANADVDGPRNILFGVNSGGVDGSGIVGISESALVDLKKAHRLVSALIEPTLQLAFIYDMINGKLVGTLEIDGCDFGPYFVGQDFSESLSLGACWVRDGLNLKAVERASLMQGGSQGAAPAEKSVRLIEKPDFVVGFNDEPECELLEMAVPDTSDPPFADEQSETTKTQKFTQAIKDTVGTMTTQILRFGQGADKETESDTNAQSAIVDDAGKILAEAKNHYYFEEKAVHLNMCVRNRGTEEVEDVSIEFGFPRLPDFDVADRLYTSPFDKRSPAAIRNMGYADVERRSDAIFVRNKVGPVAPNNTQQALRCPLRLAVGPRMQGRKLAILYKIRGPHEQVLGKGRLKIKFGQVAC